MTLSRRDALKGLLGASAIAAVQANPTAIYSGEPPDKAGAIEAKQEGLITSPTEKRAVECAATDVLMAEAEQITVYRNRLHALREKKKLEDPEYPAAPAQAISIPYATLPLNFYARRTKTQLAVPEPKIPNLHAGMTGGWGAWQAMEVCRMLSEMWHVMPAGIDILRPCQEFTLKLPDGSPCLRDRVVSPKYVIDIDEPHYGMRTTANMFIDAVDGIWYEWDCKMKQARDVIKFPKIVKTGRAVAKSTSMAIMPDQIERHPAYMGTIEQELQVREIQVSIVREAYMLEFFAWNTGAGWAKGHV
jgi:hypothetical protein